MEKVPRIRQLVGQMMETIFVNHGVYLESGEGSTPSIRWVKGMKLMVSFPFFCATKTKAGKDVVYEQNRKFLKIASLSIHDTPGVL